MDSVNSERNYPLISEDEILLTGNDVARMLNISRGKAYQMIADGEIPSITFGRLVRVRKQDLVNMVAEKVRNQSLPVD